MKSSVKKTSDILAGILTDQMMKSMIMLSVSITKTHSAFKCLSKGHFSQ